MCSGPERPPPEHYRKWIMTHELLLQRVWGQDNSGGSGPVHTYVKRLRRKLGDNPDSPRYIFTRRRVGYWMEKGEAE